MVRPKTVRAAGRRIGVVGWRLGAAIVIWSMPAWLPLPSDAARAQAQFVVGWNQPWIAYGHDFGENAWGHDGIATNGWTYQTWSDSRGLTRTARVDASPCGTPALKVTSDLEGGHPSRSKGEALVSLREHRPLRDGIPQKAGTVDVEGGSVRVRLWVPYGSAGTAGVRNGVQLLLKSSVCGASGECTYSSLYTPWVNLEPAFEGTCFDVSAAVGASAPSAYRDPAFDTRHVSMIGVKLAVPDGSSATLKGDIYINEVELSGTPDALLEAFDQFEFERHAGHAARHVHGGVPVVRVFVFADGGASPEFDESGKPVGLDARFFDDFDALLQVAQRQGLKLMPVLLDHRWCFARPSGSVVPSGHHGDVIRDAVKREAFLNEVLKVFLERYASSPWIDAIDVINEPEWVMSGVPAEMPAAVKDSITVDEMRSFVSACVDLIHRYGVRVTVGSARSSWLRHWQGIGLDFYQFHWYDWMEAEEPFPWPAATTLGLDKPCLIGEVPTMNTKYSASQFLEDALNKGYAGLLLWSYAGSDDRSDFSRFCVSQPFTDEPLAAGASTVRAVHITEIRARVDALRARFGPVGANQYTDPVLIPGGTVVRARHVAELRQALALVYVALGKPEPQFADPDLTGLRIKALHMEQLRTGVKAIECDR